jgi:hypothetical protein
VAIDWMSERFFLQLLLLLLGDPTSYRHVELTRWFIEDRVKRGHGLRIIHQKVRVMVQG